MQLALGGRLECLKYLHENGCPWSARLVVRGYYYETP